MATAAETKDHFSLDSIRLLAERAGQRCSLCNCGTSGPHTDSTKSLIIGEAAHIEAEAARGPRHNPKKTKEEFHDTENGIWLCRNCHKLVDRDVAQFPVEKLRQIKLEHEGRIHREMGSRGLLVPGKIFAVPHRRNRYFTGREEVLAKLAEQLKRDGKAALGQVAAISGLGGIGKTQTAIEFAYRHREDYRAVFFVVSETEADLHGGFATIAKELKLPEADEPDLKLAVQAAKRWLESEDGWLLILDNADVPELLKPFVPTTPRGHVIVTSRARNFAAIGAKAEHLASPSLEDAELFLLERTGRLSATSAERQAARDLAKELANLPLALEQAAAYMAEREASFADYLASYGRRGIELLTQGKVDTDVHQSVVITWSMNIEQVDKQSTASGDLLRAAAFLAPDAIPDEFFLESGMKISEPLGTAVKREERLAVPSLAAPLLRYSLIERDPEARTISVHRLVQAVVKASLGNRRDEILDGVAHALHEAFPEPDPSTWSRCDRLQNHVRAVAPIAREDKELVWLLDASGCYSRNRARFDEAEALLKRAVAIGHKLLNPGDPQIAASLNNLANVYRDQGRFDDAEKLYQQSLKVREQTFGKEHHLVATALNNLANLQRNQGHFEDAESLFLRSREIWETTLGKEHPDVALSLNNLALVYRDQKKLDEAASLFKRSLQIREKELGLQHPQVASSLHNLADVYSDQGQLEEAESHYRSSIEIREKILGKEHPDLALSLHGLATLYRQKGAPLDEAEWLYLRSLGIWKKALGNDHPHVALGLRNLARLYRQQDRDDEAAELDRQAEQVMARHRARNPGSFPPED